MYFNEIPFALLYSKAYFRIGEEAEGRLETVPG